MKHPVTRVILVPLDGSELAERALIPACQLAAGMAASLVLMRVVPERGPEEYVGQASEVEAAERYLCHVAEHLRRQGEVVLVEACAGVPAERIIEQATLWRADVIVMATHGRGGLGRLIHGSIADAVVRRARVPVFLVPGRAGALPSIHGDAIVVPVDGSAFGESALGRASELARELTTPLALVHALFWEPTQIAGLAPSFETLDEMETEARAYLDKLVDEARRAGIDATGDVVIGPAARAILGFAEKRNAAAIVMATHGRSALSRLTIGSVATDVLAHTTRPLLLVRPGPAPLATTSDVRAPEERARPAPR